MGKFVNLDTDAFFKAVLTLETVEECQRFFADVCTGKEIGTIAQRYNVAEMLRDNCVYNDIVEQTGASTATVSRVNRSLNEGSHGGYQIVFERLKK